MFTSKFTVSLAALAALAASSVLQAATTPLNASAVEALRAEGAAIEISLAEATGAVRFARLAPTGVAQKGIATPAQKQELALQFFDRHGEAFGLRNARTELALRSTTTDNLGQTHLTYEQRYRGVPVFGSMLKAHFGADGALRVVNGSIIPGINLAPRPSRTSSEARKIAVASLENKGGWARSSRLVVFREGLAKGVPGANHLAWEVEVGNARDKRTFVYVDAHTGKVIDAISGINESLDRRAYNAMGATAPGPNYPSSPFWVEGNPLPTGNTEADNMIYASGETYDLFFKGFGRDSFDNAGITMDSIFNRGNGCPNASWNGTFISFCPGLTTDDITGHEWGHAYTQYTHGLIYQWQPGALNESYSDIWGETVDLINGRGLDSPNNPRTAGSCTAFTTLAPSFTINSPASIAGSKSAGGASFGTQVFNLTNDIVLAIDGGGTSTTDGCEAITNGAAVAGKIALVDRGTCTFVTKHANAEAAGAVALLVANNNSGAVITMGGAGGTIPAMMVLQADGNAIKGALGSNVVNATMTRGAVGPDNSVRWLMGEESTGFNGAIRDMWSPNCYNHPAKVNDSNYGCSTSDNGGVHSNSGVPNHAYALLVDGGTFNGQTISPIGMNKAAHIYYRASAVYQGPASNFADHADALDASCVDLLGVNLNSIMTGLPSGQVITPADCAQVAKAALAVELRTPPSFCNFQPLLAKNPPDLCPAGSKASQLFHDTFDSGESSTARWSVSHDAVTSDFTPRDWVVSSSLPDGRAGSAFFGSDPDIGTCAPGGDESGVLHLDSPQITIPASVANPMLTFDHWVATETGWDGGNLKISVNGGPWTLVQAADFLYNSYNAALVSSGGGNTNPLAGQPAFTGSDGGAVDGSWGRSIVRLAPYASPKDKIRLRFDMGTDGCTGTFGWYIDDLMVFKCQK